MGTIYKTERGAEAIRQHYRAALDAWPVSAEQVRIPTRAGETFVVVSGPPDAPPLVLLHGSGANATMWLGDIATWATDFRVYAVDLIGEPGGSAPARPPLGSAAYALWLDEVLTGLGVDQFSLVATSLGGWFALDYVTRRPGRVTKLVLLCPGGIGAQTMGWLPKALLLRLFGRRGARRTARLVTGLNSPHTEAALDQVVRTFAAFNPRTERLPLFSDDQLRGIAMPLLVLVGDRDVMFDSAATAARVRRCVPHATVRVLPDVGHAILGQTTPIAEFLRT